MKRVAIGALALCTQLSGCFVFIPGSVVGKVSDGITGDRGEHCVTRAATVGSTIRLPDGRLFRVESLSGTSMRCPDASIPIRAELALLPDRQKDMAQLAAPLPAAPAPVTDAEKAAACARMAAVKPGAPQAEFQAAYQDLARLGMTWRDCK